MVSHQPGHRRGHRRRLYGLCLGPPELPAKRKQGINWVPVAAALLIGISLSGDDE